MHGAVEIRLAGEVRSYRLGLAEIEELEDKLDLSVFIVANALALELPALRTSQWKNIIRLGLAGAGMERASADMLTDVMIEEHGVEKCAPIALQVVAAALGRVYTLAPDDEGKVQTPNLSGSTSETSTEPLF